MFEKVLVTLDRSPESEEILPYIAAEGKKFGKVIIINVVHMPVLNLPIGVPGETLGPVQTEAMLKEFRRQLADAPVYLEEKAKTLRELGIDVGIEALEGPPSETIVKYIQANGITMLALSTHGHSGFREIALGSTAEYLLRHAGVPLILVTPRKKVKGKK